MKHTPGPWKATEQGQIYHQPPMEPGTFVPHVNIGQVYGPSANPNADADKRLIEAAPELLAICEAWEHFSSQGYTQASVWSFVKEDSDHPAWYAWLTGGQPALARWLIKLRRTVIAKVRSDS